MLKKIKLNIGSHNKIIGDSWINLDALKLPNVDLYCDINKQPFIFELNDKRIQYDYDKFKFLHVGGASWKNKFEDNSIDQIQMVEVLEHITFRKTVLVLREIYRILKPGGFIDIQVPDCGNAMKFYVRKQICECVPHKPKNDEEAKADEKCFKCGGKGKIHPDRWLYSFTGAQKHEYDIHQIPFTKEILKDKLEKAYFKDIKFKKDKKGWKLNVRAIK